MYYGFLGSLPLMICAFYLYIRVNKYGFSDKDFESVCRVKHFSHHLESKKFNWKKDSISILFAFAFILYCIIVALIFSLSISPEITLTASSLKNGALISVNSYLSYYNYDNARIGSPDFTTTLSIPGIVIIVLFIAFFMISNLFVYLYNIKFRSSYFKDTFFYQTFLSNFNDSKREKSEKLCNIIEIVLHALILLFMLINIIIGFTTEISDMGYWFENFLYEVTDFVYDRGFSLEWLTIECIVLNSLSILLFIGFIVVNQILYNNTWLRYMAAIMTIYNDESEHKIGIMK